MKYYFLGTNINWDQIIFKLTKLKSTVSNSSASSSSIISSLSSKLTIKLFPSFSTQSSSKAPAPPPSSTVVHWVFPPILEIISLLTWYYFSFVRYKAFVEALIKSVIEFLDSLLLNPRHKPSLIISKFNCYFLVV